MRKFILPFIDEVIVTVSAENEEEYRRILIDDAKLPVKLVLGAEERHLSAMKGLAATTGDLIVVHDGVRPFADADLINAVLEAAVEHGAAMLGLPSTVQVKLVSDEEFITGSLDRAHSWLGQTPQAFSGTCSSVPTPVRWRTSTSASATTPIWSPNTPGIR